MRNSDYFVFDGMDCRDYGIKLQNCIEFSGAAPNVEKVSVPGRNGDLLYYDGAYANVTGEAECYALQEDVYGALDQINKWMFLAKSYRRLEVSSEPEIYRMARISEGPETAIRVDRLAPFTITFDCKPQKFLLSGEEPITITEAATVTNPGFQALPLLEVYGSGAATLQIGDISIAIADIDEYVTIDCEIMDAYKGTENKNSTITAPEFPRLENGENAISWTGGITKIEITPRWWTL